MFENNLHKYIYTQIKLNMNYFLFGIILMPKIFAKIALLKKLLITVTLLHVHLCGTLVMWCLGIDGCIFFMLHTYVQLAKVSVSSNLHDFHTISNNRIS